LATTRLRFSAELGELPSLEAEGAAAALGWTKSLKTDPWTLAICGVF